MILEVFLILVERIVLVDILNIRHRLVGCVVAFVARLTVGRVALRIVYVLVTAQNRCFHLVVIAATEVVVIVVSRVVPYRIEHNGVHFALYRSEKLLISVKVTFLLIVETIESDVLKRTGTRCCRKSISDRCLCRNLTPLCGDVTV